MRYLGRTTVAVCALVALLAPVAHAGGEPMPYQFGVDGGVWTFGNDAFGVFFEQGMGVTDITGKGDDPVEGCAKTMVNGKPFVDKDNALIERDDGSLKASGRVGSITGGREIERLDTDIVRMKYKFTNTGATKKKVEVLHGCELVGDAAAVIDDTTSGNTTFENDEAWLIAHNSAAVSPAYIVLAVGVSGGLGNFANNGLYRRGWFFSLAAGASKTFWFIVAVATSLTAAQSLAQDLDSAADMRDAGLIEDSEKTALNWRLPANF
jgi:hypothetical protein